MGTAKICTGVALLFAIVGVILKFVAIALPNFVDVHVINDIDDVAEENRIAQVGVYQSVIDTESGDALEAADRANIPPLKIESPSTEFPLLFPAQEHFFPEVLPVNAAVIALLDGLSDVVDLGTLFLQVPLEAVEAVEFENCEQYSDDLTTASDALFSAFQNGVLPLVITDVGNTGRDGLNAAAAASALTASTLVTVANATFNGGFALAPGCADTLTDAGLDTLLDDANAGACIASLTFGAGLRDPVLGEFIGALFDACIADAAITTFAECGNQIENEFLLADTGIELPATFGPDSIVDLCLLPSLSCDTKAAFLEGVISPIAVFAGLSNNEGLTQLAGALGAYTTAFKNGAVDDGALFADGTNLVEIAQGEIVFNAGDTAATPFVAGCQLVNAIIPGAPCQNIASFFATFPTVVALSDAVAGAAFEEFAQIFLGCFESGLTAAVCPTFFTAVVADGVFGEGAIQAVQNLDGFIDEQCEENEVDKAKVSEGQIYIALSAALEIVAVLVLFGAVLTPDGISKFVAPVGAGFAIIGAIFVFTALATVASAPVYEGVGDEPNGVDFEVIFVAGVVGTLAAIDGALMVVAGIVALIATVIGFMSNGDDEEYEGKNDEVAPVAEEDPEDKL